MLGYATASPMAAQIATQSNNASTPPAIVKTALNSALAALAAQWPEGVRRGVGAGSFAGVLSGSVMNVGRDVSADYRNRQVSLKLAAASSKSIKSRIWDHDAVSTLSYGDQMPGKRGHSRTLTLFSCRSC